MTREERRAAAIKRAWTAYGGTVALGIVEGVLDASGLLDELESTERSAVPSPPSAWVEAQDKPDEYECQFRDSAMPYHTPFSERAPICWSCFNAAIFATGETR